MDLIKRSVGERKYDSISSDHHLSKSKKKKRRNKMNQSTSHHRLNYNLKRLERK